VPASLRSRFQAARDMLLAELDGTRVLARESAR
jgi:hypothetical protein